MKTRASEQAASVRGWGDWVEGGVKGLSKKEENLRDRDNGMVIAEGGAGGHSVGEGVNGDGQT